LLKTSACCVKLEVTPVSGERVQGIVRDIYATPRAVVDRAAEIEQRGGQPGELHAFPLSVRLGGAP
jgi:hypothetical protein